MDRLNHLIEFKIGLGFRLIDVKLRFADLFGIMPPIPRLQRSFQAVFRRKVLQHGAFALGRSEGCFPHAHHHIHSGFGRFGHFIVELEMRKRLKAEQLGLFIAQIDDFSDQSAIIFLARGATNRHPAFLDRLSQIPTGRHRQERLKARAGQGNNAQSIDLALFGFSGRACDKAIGKSCQIGLGFQRQGESRLASKHILAESHL